MDLITTHKLDFEVAPWDFVFTSDPTMKKFRVGTCHGLFGYDKTYYFILAIGNDQPGNGHFEDVLEWFYFSCKRDKKHLKIMQIMEERFYKHLIKKRGFVNSGTKTKSGLTVVKYF